MRLLNRPLAFLLALAVGGGSVLVIIEVIVQLTGSHPLIVPWHRWGLWARTTAWNDSTVETVAGVLIAVGVILLFVELKPRRATRLPMTADGDDTDAAITVHGVRNAVQTAVLDVDGISKAGVKVKRRKVVVRAGAIGEDKESAQQLKGPVTAAASDELGQLGLVTPLRVVSYVKAAS